jgi:hypothetical protein
MGTLDFVCRSSFFEICPQFSPQTYLASNHPMRRHARLPFEGEIWVSWKCSRGLVQKMRAKCMDLSAEGARLLTDLPIAARTNISLTSPRHGNLGTASVRHCVREGLKYSLGVEFTSSLPLSGQGRKRCLEEIQPPAESQP